MKKGRGKRIISEFYDSIFPDEFRATDDWQSFMWSKLQSEHAYLNVFSAAGDEESSSVTTKYLLLLTRLVSALFINTLLCIAYYQNDDGNSYCEQYTDRVTCSEASSKQDLIAHACQWHAANHTCIYRQPSFQLLPIVVFLIVSVLFVIAANRVVEFCFHHAHMLTKRLAPIFAPVTAKLAFKMPSRKIAATSGSDGEGDGVPISADGKSTKNKAQKSALRPRGFLAGLFGESAADEEFRNFANNNNGVTEEDEEITTSISAKRNPDGSVVLQSGGKSAKLTNLSSAKAGTGVPLFSTVMSELRVKQYNARFPGPNAAKYRRRSVATRDDEFAEVQTARGTMLRAASLVKQRHLVDKRSAAEEGMIALHQLQQFLQHDRRNRSRSMVTGMSDNVFDLYCYDHYRSLLTAIPSRVALKHTVKVIERIKVEALSVRKHIATAAADPSNAQSDVVEELLVKYFVAQLFPHTPSRNIARKYLLQHEHSPFHYPERSTFSTVLEYLCAAALPLIYLVMTYFTYRWSSQIGSGATDLWLFLCAMTLLQDMLVVQPFKIVFEWVVVNEPIAAEVRSIFRHLTLHSKLILMRSSYGTLANCNSLVQRCNPAVRVARDFPQLPVARLLLSLNGYDIPLPAANRAYLTTFQREKAGKIANKYILGEVMPDLRNRTLVERVGGAVHYFSFVLHTLFVSAVLCVYCLPMSLTGSVLEGFTALAVNIVILVLYFLSRFSLILVLVVAGGILAAILIVAGLSFHAARSARLQEEQRHNELVFARIGTAEEVKQPSRVKAVAAMFTASSAKPQIRSKTSTAPAALAGADLDFGLHDLESNPSPTRPTRGRGGLSIDSRSHLEDELTAPYGGRAGFSPDSRLTEELARQQQLSYAAIYRQDNNNGVQFFNSEEVPPQSSFAGANPMRSGDSARRGSQNSISVQQQQQQQQQYYSPHSTHKWQQQQPFFPQQQPPLFSPQQMLPPQQEFGQSVVFTGDEFSQYSSIDEKEDRHLDFPHNNNLDFDDVSHMRSLVSQGRSVDNNSRSAQSQQHMSFNNQTPRGGDPYLQSQNNQVSPFPINNHSGIAGSSQSVMSGISGATRLHPHSNSNNYSGPPNLSPQQILSQMDAKYHDVRSLPISGRNNNILHNSFNQYPPADSGPYAAFGGNPNQTTIYKSGGSTYEQFYGGSNLDDNSSIGTMRTNNVNNSNNPSRNLRNHPQLFSQNPQYSGRPMDPRMQQQQQQQFSPQQQMGNSYAAAQYPPPFADDEFSLTSHQMSVMTPFTAAQSGGDGFVDQMYSARERPPTMGSPHSQRRPQPQFLGQAPQPALPYQSHEQLFAQQYLGQQQQQQQQHGQFDQDPQQYEDYFPADRVQTVDRFSNHNSSPNRTSQTQPQTQQHQFSHRKSLNSSGPRRAPQQQLLPQSQLDEEGSVGTLRTATTKQQQLSHNQYTTRHASNPHLAGNSTRMQRFKQRISQRANTDIDSADDAPLRLQNVDSADNLSALDGSPERREERSQLSEKEKRLRRHQERRDRERDRSQSRDRERHRDRDRDRDRDRERSRDKHSRSRESGRDRHREHREHQPGRDRDRDRERENDRQRDKHHQRHRSSRESSLDGTEGHHKEHWQEHRAVLQISGAEPQPAGDSQTQHHNQNHVPAGPTPQVLSSSVVDDVSVLSEEPRSSPGSHNNSFVTQYITSSHQSPPLSHSSPLSDPMAAATVPTQQTPFQQPPPQMAVKTEPFAGFEEGDDVYDF